MEKLLELVSAEAHENITELAKTLGIDIQRYIPIRYENYPFFSIFCIDRENSTSENKWIIKFEILVFDADRIDELFGKFKVTIQSLRISYNSHSYTVF